MHKRGVLAQCAAIPGCLAAALLCSGMGAAEAQTPAATANPIVPTSAASSAAPYQDRVIEGMPAQEPDDLAPRAYNSGGLPRSYSLEALWDQQQSQGLRRSQQGLKAHGFLDTMHYGSFSGQLTLQNVAVDDGSANPGPANASSFVLRQIGMPFDGGWRADNAVGMLNLPSIELARTNPRLALPTPAMQGVTTQWQQNQGLQVLAGWGRAGSFTGYPVARFGTSAGSYGALGLQQNTRASDGVWQWGALMAQAHQVPPVFSPAPSGTALVNARAGYAAVRREWSDGTSLGKPAFAQLNALSGENHGADAAGTATPNASGLWLDGGFSRGAHQHQWGLFRLEPQLGWLDLPTASDLQGGYWRHAWRTRQWSLDSGLELLRPVAGSTPQGFFANSSSRYQYSTSTSFGAALNLRRYGVQTQSLLVYTQFTNALGHTRAQLDLASASTGEQQNKVQIDHDWNFVQNMHVATALSLDRERRPTANGITRSRGLGLATNIEYALGQRWSLNSSLQGRWSGEQTQYTLNAGISWRMTPQWTVLANVYANQGSSSATALAQSPLSSPVAGTARSQDRGLFVALRYQDAAGTPSAPTGGAPGAAAGRLLGSVYLDENKNARRDAAERGAANVTVLLDGRYAVQTDAQGRFEFAYVVAGPHVLTVISDNLPLPWVLEQDGRTALRIYTRETTTIDLAASKP